MTGTPQEPSGFGHRSADSEREALNAQVNALNDELERLRDRVSSHPHDLAMLERRLADARSDARSTAANNERLAATLREAREQIITLKAEVDRLAQPPASFGVFLAAAEEHTADIWTSGRKMRVSVSPDVDLTALTPGREVMVNEALNVVDVLEFDEVGEVVLLKEVLADGERALVVGHGDEESVVRLGWDLRQQHLRSGDSLMIDRRGALRVRADSQARRRGARARGGAGHRLLGDRRSRQPDRADPRRRGAAIPAQGPVRDL